MKLVPRAGILCAVFALLSSVLLSSCTVSETGQLVLGPLPAETAKKPANTPDTKSPYYSSTQYISVNEKALPSLNQSNSRVEVDLGSQRARVYRTGQGKDLLVIETQISTGKQGHNTPSGSFRFLEKTVDKKSNLYGKWVDSKTGETLISDGDSREPPSSPHASFRGAPMPYWMRITPGGVGMHIGYVPNYPASHGCIRVPKQVQPLIYSKVRVGTPVTITH
ncbi:MAG: L,D-transpeptidase family protein [Verrucomicrobiae bacterium]|nr:L,D-transpeptidase family protein [Verrucomicrobiae bacterium]